MGGGIRKSDGGVPRGKPGPSRTTDLEIQNSNYPHVPVLVQEAIQYLNFKPEGVYVDGTVGSGGHSSEILSYLPEKSRLICLDRDPDAIRLSHERLSSDHRVQLVQANFANLGRVMQELAIDSIDGILLDLGMSSYQIEKSGRGFSFNREEPLDMRMNPDHKPTGEHLINTLPVKSLQALLREYGEERRAKPLARAIVRARDKNPIKTAAGLAQIIEGATPKSRQPWKRHPATKTFQALRIAVNKEMDNLETFLRKIPALMAAGGRLVVISYHSLEDRQVKKAMVHWEKACICPPDFPVCACDKSPTFTRLFKKGQKPEQAEIHNNPRARSAIMRVAERMSS
ncbi:MAG: 16S rRNA (cytosine(1402)-N(4))-methyltransferase RsmH [Deltaproteobacteria bacterium]|nr:16S rRNA (cytosine(1402)-N(4))-methyltransferase RsmH [Deltaproteobacteria bacterium]